ncbi:hypothetical protein [Duodenibacillus massiliensis]|uniref:hypothetical protein n=1 Tax=Duodenibacillus massiliensis TaxID=1852381 RepID=UPI003F7DC57C
MNPTFSSPVLQERVTYTWEDLQKAAAGVFTDTLTNEKARLESLAQKGIPLQDMPPAEPAVPVTPTDQPRTPVFEELEAARPAGEPQVQAACAVPAAAAPRTQAASACMHAGFRMAKNAQAMESAPRAKASETPAAAMQGASPAKTVDEHMIEEMTHEVTAQLCERLAGNIDIIVEMALQTAAGRIRKDLGKAVEVAVEQTVRQTLGKL